MKDIKIDGKGHFAGGEYGSICIDGLAECLGTLKAEWVDVDGKLTCMDGMNVKKIDCDGIAEFHADIYAETMDVDGMLTVTEGTKIEAESIKCDGLIQIQGQISADELYADGYVRAKEIVGDRIVIRSIRSRLAKIFFKGSSEVELIEATTIDLRGVAAQTVNGRDIVIGPGCRIEHLDCSGTLKLDPAAQVEHITGDYTLL